MDIESWSGDEVRCPDGLLLRPTGDANDHCVPCSEIMNMMYQQPLNACAAEAANKRWSEMDARYRRLATDFPVHAVELREEQEAWVKRAESTCDAERAKARGGSIGPLWEGLCRDEQASKRIETLKALRARWSRN